MAGKADSGVLVLRVLFNFALLSLERSLLLRVLVVLRIVTASQNANVDAATLAVFLVFI